MILDTISVVPLKLALFCIPDRKVLVFSDFDHDNLANWSLQCKVSSHMDVFKIYVANNSITYVIEEEIPITNLQRITVRMSISDHWEK